MRGGSCGGGGLGASGYAKIFRRLVCPSISRGLHSEYRVLWILILVCIDHERAFVAVAPIWPANTALCCITKFGAMEGHRSELDQDTRAPVTAPVPSRCWKVA